MPVEKTKILIVDDDPLTRMTLTQVFQQLGLEVASAQDGFSALSEMRRQRPDVLLSDLNMPGMSGFELLSIVRRRFPAIAVIAMSGAFSGEGVQPGVAADNFYEKATRLPMLLQLVDTLVKARTLPRFRRPRAETPEWIAGNDRLPTGESYVTISCPECLRTFIELPLGSHLVHQTGCRHCEFTIRYAIVQPTDPALPQSFQIKQPAHA